MTNPVPLERRYTLEEYFALEETSNTKHEFFQGQILAMTGASLRHARIAGNIYSAIRAAIPPRYEVFASDLRLRTPGGLYTYPDVMVVCGGVQLSSDDRLDTVTNPAVIVEVLSPSTAAYDRGEKFRLYGGFDTLREYLLVDQSSRLVELHARADAGRPWARHQWESESTSAEVASIGVRLSLAGIYEGIDFGSSTATR